MSAAVHHHRDVCRWVSLFTAILVLLLTAALLVLPSPSARAEGGWRPGWCRQGEGMTVVVDFSSAPASQWPSVPGNEFNGYVVRCVIGAVVDDSLDVVTKGLTAAGIPFKGSGFVTEILGYRHPVGWLRGTGTTEQGWTTKDWTMESSYEIDGFQFFAVVGNPDGLPVPAPKFAAPGGQGPTDTPSTPGDTGPSASQGTPTTAGPTSKPTTDPTATRTTTRPPTRPRPTAKATRGPITRPTPTHTRPLPTKATRPPTHQPLPGSPLSTTQASNPEATSTQASATPSVSSTSAAASQSPSAENSTSATAPDSASPSSSSLQPVYGTEAPAASTTPLSEADGTSPWAWGGIFTVLLGSIGALIWRVRGTPPAPGAEE